MDAKSTGQPPGTIKYVDTPVGKFEIPQGTADALGRMSNLELMREYVEKCRNFIDPFLFQEMADRGLIHRGDYHRDIEARLLEMERPEGVLGGESVNEPDLYRARGYKDQADYFSTLASEFALPVDMVEKMAADLEPADHFDGLLAHLQETHDNVYGKMYDEPENSLDDEYDEGMEP